MDIWAIRYKDKVLLHFISPQAHAWMAGTEHYHDLPPDSVLWVSVGEYQEILDTTDGLVVLEDSGGKEN